MNILGYSVEDFKKWLFAPPAGTADYQSGFVHNKRKMRRKGKIAKMSRKRNR